MFGPYAIVFWDHDGSVHEVGYYNFHGSFDFSINSTIIKWHTAGQVSEFLKNRMFSTSLIKNHFFHCSILVYMFASVVHSIVFAVLKFDFVQKIVCRCLLQCVLQNVMQGTRKQIMESTNVASIAQSVQMGLITTSQVV